MQAASRESYAAGRAALAEFAAGADASALAGAADEVLSVAALLQRELRLRRALSDPARSGADRASLLDNLMGDKISAGALDLIKALVAGRWSSPTELLTGVEQLGVDAALAGADKSGDLSEVEDELFRFGQVVSGSPDLAAVLTDAKASVERRATLVANLLGGKAKPTTIRLAQVALTGFGGRRFDSGLSRLIETAAARRDSQVAYVTVAKALSDEDEQRLATKLAQLYGRSVSLKVTVDPAVLGGASVQVGPDLYDGTVARRLTNARNALAYTK
jgi:F-type H+-transporting ATPase subunit delta